MDNLKAMFGFVKRITPATVEEKTAGPANLQEQDTVATDNVSASTSMEGAADGDKEDVFRMPPRATVTGRDYRNYGATRKQESLPDGLQYKGLLDDPHLKDFFSQNHWQFGNYDGAAYRSQEQMELGKQAIVARFQNALSNYISKKQAHLTKLKATALETRGVCNTTTEQLELACKHVENDLDTLMQQMEWSKTRQGWVMDALNRYEIGFVKGLRTTIPFDHLL